jgi:hypothetical protein
VQANILKTLQGMRGGVGRKGRGRDMTGYQEQAARAAERRNGRRPGSGSTSSSRSPSWPTS